jgi:hypothetical protein
MRFKVYRLARSPTPAVADNPTRDQPTYQTPRREAPAASAATYTTTRRNWPAKNTTADAWTTSPRIRSQPPLAATAESSGAAETPPSQKPASQPLRPHDTHPPSPHATATPRYLNEANAVACKAAPLPDLPSTNKCPKKPLDSLRSQETAKAPARDRTTVPRRACQVLTTNEQHQPCWTSEARHPNPVATNEETTDYTSRITRAPARRLASTLRLLGTHSHTPQTSPLKPHRQHAQDQRPTRPPRPPAATSNMNPPFLPSRPAALSSRYRHQQTRNARDK